MPRQRIVWMLATIALLVASEGVLGQRAGTVNLRRPDFARYPAIDSFTGPPAPADFSTTMGARKYRTVIEEGALAGPNFAGHFAVVTWGCGTMCQAHAIVDVRSGRITMVPFPTAYGVDYRLDSDLLVADLVNECLPSGTVGPDTSFWYAWSKGDLRKVDAVRIVEPCDKSSGSIPAVTLFNNTLLDLEVVRGDRVVAEILPGQSRDFTPRAEEWLHFGMIAHRYDFAAADWKGLSRHSKGTHVRLQVESNGGIYFAESRPFPIHPSSRQPDGFPLRPLETVDLTGLPHSPSDGAELAAARATRYALRATRGRRMCQVPSASADGVASGGALLRTTMSASFPLPPVSTGIAASVTNNS